MKDISGKTAVVTGAGSGIGRATAMALAREGAAVAACDLDPGAAKDTVEAINRLGIKASAHQVDVSSESEMQALVDAVLGEHGVVDIVVNNAGIMGEIGPTHVVPLSRFRKVMDVNFWGMVYGSIFFLPHLLQRPSAHLVNVVSNAGFFTYPRMAAYNSSKFAVRGFTETLRMELGGTPVGVTAVYPGSTKTHLFGGSPVIEESRRRALQAKFEKSWGRPPEAVADIIIRAIRKNRARALSGPDTAVVDAIVRLSPGGYARVLAKPVDMFVDKIIGRTD